MSDDLISRSALKEEFAKHEDRKGYLIGDWENIIDNAPTVDAIPNKEGYEMLNKGYVSGYERGKEERPQGEWIEIDTNPPNFLGHRFYFCSKCNREIDVMTPDESLDDYPYCHCGACMIKEEENE